jgi:hypothetical protein
LSRILQGDTSAAPEEKLNEIYITVLTNSVSDDYDDQEKDKLYKMLKTILGTIIILFPSLSAPPLARLLEIPKKDIYQTLYDLHSILEVPEDQDQPIRLHHPSFRDFLLDQKRCTDVQFWIDEKMAHNDLFVRCLELMSRHLRRDMCNLRLPGVLASEVEKSTIENCLSQDLQYACRYWVQHLQRAQIDLCNHKHVHKFFQEHFLHWLEALSLIGQISEGVHLVAELSKHLPTLQVSNNV